MYPTGVTELKCQNSPQMGQEKPFLATNLVGWGVDVFCFQPHF